MSSFFYLLLFIIPVIIAVVIVVIVRIKRNDHSELYSEGLRNENEGRYYLAMENYVDALNSAGKITKNNKLSGKITQRIKILRNTIDYEKNFQNGQTFEELTRPMN